MIRFLVATVAQVLILAIIAHALLSWFPGQDAASRVPTYPVERVEVD